LWLNP